MDLFRKYRSPLGYFMDDEEKRKDSYGVDHSGFSTRDELEYQTARSERENDEMSWNIKPHALKEKTSLSKIITIRE